MRPRLAFMARASIVLAACALHAVACTAPVQTPDPAAAASAPQAAEGGNPPRLVDPKRFVIAVLGDSITAGLGLTTAQAYPNRLQEMFAAEGYSEVEVVNNGLSGDTTAGALRRVDEAVEAGVRIAVVALGGNDALRGLSPTETRENLSQIIEAINKQGVGVVLVGMQAPPNLGADYQDAFRAVFVQLAAQYGRTIVYIPFLLEGVAGQPALNQPDGIHPNEQGAKAIAEHLYPLLRKLVDQMSSGAGGE
jgi:acyl-CoA thioesterase-1